MKHHANGVHYVMPAEWEPHEATWIGWPHNPDDWPGKLEAVEWVFVEMVRHLSRGERVHILVPDEEVRASAWDKLEKAGVDAAAVTFHPIATDRNWLRDSGAIFVRNPGGGPLKALKFQFNAWAKYANFKLDRAIPDLMAGVAGCPVEKPHIQAAHHGGDQWMVLEGGAIDVNGAGLILATEECLVDKVQERNPGFGIKETTEALQRHLGGLHVIWLKRGIAGDDTHGHVDDCARFVNERTVVAAEEKNPDDPNHEPLAENLAILRDYRDEKGRLKVVPLPMPEPMEFDGLLLPASYANFYIANNTVLVPTFNDPNDRAALGILQDLFPNRVVRGIHAVDLVWGLGTLHCLTQQQPGE